MRHSFILETISLLLALVAAPNKVGAFDSTHHQLQIELDPSTHFARIEDTIKFKGSLENCESFYLHANLKVDKISDGWKVKNSSGVLKFDFVKNRTKTCPETLVLSYSGVLHDRSIGPDDTKDFDGFFFSGESYFYPRSNKSSSQVTFEMQVSLPEPWQAVSQGQRQDSQLLRGRKIVSWKSSYPTEEIFLIGNKFDIYTTVYNGLPLYVFLLQQEDALASKYLQAAKGYIDFYSKLIGPYPYKKFALIENSRQTGYGMPSFTLMGSRIIRFPFILHSSYPHEILHNWWGNGVLPDIKQGNWSEGLTAYLADHLLMELKGKGAPYRFQEMMKYLNYVNESNDFLLSEFSYRDSMASQAIGYAKLLMVFHMLRTEIGDENFLKGLKKFYATYKYKYANYGDIRENFEEVSGKDLSIFFRQWIHRKGAPEIRLKQTSYVYLKNRYNLKVTVEQSAPVFELKLPVAIWTTSSPLGEIHFIKLNEKNMEFSFELSSEPVALQLDPYNDVFRRLGGDEVPASLGQTYGAEAVSALLPKNGNLDYQKFAQSVAKPEMIFTGIGNKPEGNIWFFGIEHMLRKKFIEQLKKLNIVVTKNGIKAQGKSFHWENHSFVFTLPRTDHKKGTMTWVIAGNAESIPGLIRKLPHYGKYGYLVFEGTAPKNIEKGTWPSNLVGMQKVFKDGKPRLLPEQKPLVSFLPFP